MFLFELLDDYKVGYEVFKLDNNSTSTSLSSETEEQIHQDDTVCNHCVQVLQF